MEKVVALLCVFGLGMCFSLLGSISVKLMPRLKIDTGKFGTLISSFMITCLVASVVVGVLIDTWGHKPFAIIGFIVTAFCILIIARAKTYGPVLGACLLLGVGAMCLNDVGNTLMPHVLFGGENAPAALNLGNVFFGLGLFLTPFIVSFLFRKTSYENAVSVLALIALVPVVFAVLTEYPDVKVGFEASTAVKLLVDPVVIIAALMLFCYISMEMSFSNWLPPFGKEVISRAKPEADASAADASAQRMLSVFAVAMMAGRFIASQVPAIKTHGVWFIAVAALVATVVILLMMVNKSISLAWVLAILAGLAFAPCFTTTVGVTFDKFEPKVHGSVFGIIFAVGLLGAVIIPKAIGNLAKGSSIQKSLKLLIPACIALIILALVLGRL